MWAIGFALIITLFLIETKMMPKVDDENSFKKWWRRNVIGIYNGSDF